MQRKATPKQNANRRVQQIKRPISESSDGEGEEGKKRRRKGKTRIIIRRKEVKIKENKTKRKRASIDLFSEDKVEKERTTLCSPTLYSTWRKKGENRKDSKLF